MYATIPCFNFQRAPSHLLPELRYLLTFIQLYLCCPCLPPSQECRAKRWLRAKPLLPSCCRAQEKVLPGHQWDEEQQHLRHTSLRSNPGLAWSPVLYPVSYLCLLKCSNAQVNKGWQISRKADFFCVPCKTNSWNIGWQSIIQTLSY